MCAVCQHLRSPWTLGVGYSNTQTNKPALLGVFPWVLSDKVLNRRPGVRWLHRAAFLRPAPRAGARLPHGHRVWRWMQHGRRWIQDLLSRRGPGNFTNLRIFETPLLRGCWKFQYNWGKDVCIGLDGSGECKPFDIIKTFGNHIQDWEGPQIRFQNGKPAAIYVPAHRWSADYRRNRTVRTCNTTTYWILKVQFWSVLRVQRDHWSIRILLWRASQGRGGQRQGREDRHRDTHRISRDGLLDRGRNSLFLVHTRIGRNVTYFHIG